MCRQRNKVIAHSVALQYVLQHARHFGKRNKVRPNSCQRRKCAAACNTTEALAIEKLREGDLVGGWFPLYADLDLRVPGEREHGYLKPPTGQDRFRRSVPRGSCPRGEWDSSRSRLLSSRHAIPVAKHQSPRPEIPFHRRRHHRRHHHSRIRRRSPESLALSPRNGGGATGASGNATARRQGTDHRGYQGGMSGTAIDLRALILRDQSMGVSVTLPCPEKRGHLNGCPDDVL